MNIMASTASEDGAALDSAWYRLLFRRGEVLAGDVSGGKLD
jgi:hypothetical protein